MPADNVTSFDHTDRLGFSKMPEGYALIQLDSGHFMWEHAETDQESSIHWDKWAVWRGAWQHYNAQRGAGDE